LNALPEVLKRRCPASADLTDAKIIAEAMDVTCANAVFAAAEEFQRLVQSGKSEEESYESSCKSLMVRLKNMFIPDLLI
jgi:hypothetical protein